MFKLKSLASSLALIVCGSALSFSAQAGAPLQKNQAPGYFRMALGEFEVTALFDGHLGLDPKLLTNIPAAELDKLKERGLITQKGLLTPVNAYLVNTGTHLVLVDTGAATCFGPTMGKLPESLKAAGYAPEQVDMILITHMHGDHLCGVRSADGKAAFPNASLHIAKEDVDYWTNDEAAAKAPADMKDLFVAAKASIKPYQESAKLKTFSGSQMLLPGVQVVDTKGHTPGHAAYQFTSQGKSMLMIGDLIHSHVVQIPRPQTTIAFDSDSKAAMPMRKKVFDQAVQNKTWIAASHLPFPGIGQVRTEGKSYVWLPADYAPYGVSR